MNNTAELREEDQYLDYRGLCRLLKISYGTARNWKSTGKLPHTSLNGKVLFPKKPILKELRRNGVKSTDATLEEINNRS